MRSLKINIYILPFLLLACSSDKDTPSSTTKPETPAAATTITTPSETRYYGVRTKLNLGQKLITITSLAEMTESKEVIQFIEVNQVEYDKKTFYAKRKASVDKIKSPKSLYIEAMPNDVQLLISSNDQLKQHFAKVAQSTKKYDELNVSANVTTILKNVKAQHLLWTYRCQTAADWVEVSDWSPSAIGTQLLSLPRYSAIDRHLNIRTTAVEVDLKALSVHSLPSQIGVVTIRTDTLGKKVLFGDKLAATSNNLYWDLNLYDPSRVIEFFGYCRGIYAGLYGKRNQNTAYEDYFPTQNSKAEELARNKKLLKRGHDFYPSKINKDLKPIQNFDSAAYPTKENLTPEDLQFLQSMDFNIPTSGDFQ